MDDIVDVNFAHGWCLETPLIVASREGDLETVRELMKNEKLDVNLHDRYKSTPLLHASLNNHWEVVQELLKHHCKLPKQSCRQSPLLRQLLRRAL